jgi:hypothetical protein
MPGERFYGQKKSWGWFGREGRQRRFAVISSRWNEAATETVRVFFHVTRLLSFQLQFGNEEGILSAMSKRSK